MHMHMQPMHMHVCTCTCAHVHLLVVSPSYLPAFSSPDLRMLLGAAF